VAKPGGAVLAWSRGSSGIGWGGGSTVLDVWRGEEGCDCKGRARKRPLEESKWVDEGLGTEPESCEGTAAGRSEAIAVEDSGLGWIRRCVE